MQLTDGQVASILRGIRKQVEWNGWEEPYVTERFKEELAKCGARETTGGFYIDQLNTLCAEFGCTAGEDRLHWLRQQLTKANGA